MRHQDYKRIMQMLRDKRISRFEADRMIGTLIAYETTTARMTTDIHFFNNPNEMN